MIDYMRPEDVPACKCGDLCDRLTVRGEWRCSKCDPKAKERFDRSVRLLRKRDEILRREGRLQG